MDKRLLHPLDPSLTLEFTADDAVALLSMSDERKVQVFESRRLLQERSAQLMQQKALLKQDIDTFKKDIGNPLLWNPLNPAVWSMLSVELLQLIFARMPLPEIIRLRLLSKTWNQYVTGVTPGFTKVCAELSPKLFALVTQENRNPGDRGVVGTRIYDTKAKRWHQFRHQTVVEETCETMCAGDGGLVCIVSTDRDKEQFPLVITVSNPLTRQWRQLPSSSLSSIQPRMVQLVMDGDSKGYKVVVVGQKERDLVAKVYSSVTGEWSEARALSDLIFGCHYRWINNRADEHMTMLLARKLGPCAYDCAKGTLLELDDGSNPCRGIMVKNYALVKDRLFVLQEESYVSGRHFSGEEEEGQRYCISEYQAQSCQPHWVQLRVHRCTELEILRYREGLKVHLLASKGFLIVNAYCGRDRDSTLLYDLSSSQWETISKIPEVYPIFRGKMPSSPGEMFELQWDAVP